MPLTLYLPVLFLHAQNADGALQQILEARFRERRQLSEEASAKHTAALGAFNRQQQAQQQAREQLPNVLLAVDKELSQLVKDCALSHPSVGAGDCCRLRLTREAAQAAHSLRDTLPKLPVGLQDAIKLRLPEGKLQAVAAVDAHCACVPYQLKITMRRTLPPLDSAHTDKFEELHGLWVTVQGGHLIVDGAAASSYYFVSGAAPMLFSWGSSWDGWLNAMLVIDDPSAFSMQVQLYAKLHGSFWGKVVQVLTHSAGSGKPGSQAPTGVYQPVDGSAVSISYAQLVAASEQNKGAWSQPSLLPLCLPDGGPLPMPYQLEVRQRQHIPHTVRAAAALHFQTVAVKWNRGSPQLCLQAHRVGHTE